MPGHDAVVNFAAETHVDRSISGAAPFVATNVAGVQVLLQACLDAGTGPVVQVSTDEVYGSTASGSWTGRAPLAPSSPYFACPGGTAAKCTPRMTPRRDTGQLACAVCGQYPGDPGSSPARDHSRK